ncbi:MAG: hypothetical protein ACLS9K_14565 [Lachnospira eligens]
MTFCNDVTGIVCYNENDWGVTYEKLIPVLLAIVLIVVIAAIAFGGSLIDRFSYSRRADLNSYYGLEAQDDIAILLQDEIVEEKAKLIDGVCYFDLPG